MATGFICTFTLGFIVGGLIFYKVAKWVYQGRSR